MNEFLESKERETQSYSLFQKTIKSKSIETVNEAMYFWNGFYSFLIIILLVLSVKTLNGTWDLRLDDRALLLSMSVFSLNNL